MNRFVVSILDLVAIKIWFLTAGWWVDDTNLCFKRCYYFRVPGS